jgi:predicted glycosyltransferase
LRIVGPSNLKRKSRDTFAKNEIGSDSESISEYENINETSSVKTYEANKRVLYKIKLGFQV